MDRGKSIARVSATGIGVNLVLVAFKAAVGHVTGSVAIMMDAVNNLSDALSSVITVVGTRLAGKGPDREHPYGHGQIEYITSIVIAVIIILAGITAFMESLGKVMEPEPASYTVASLIIVAVAVAAKLWLGHYTRSQGRRLNSQALAASGTDAMFDSLISLSTLVAALISMIWHVSVEGWLGMVISFAMLRSGIRAMWESLSAIIGLRIDPELARNLKSLVCSHENVLGAYDLELHSYGPGRLIGSVHVEVPDDLTAREIHTLTRHLSEDVFRSFGILLTVGIYASNTEGGYAEMKSKLMELAAQHPEVLQVHGFYVDRERKLVSFDLILDFKADKAAVCDRIVAGMREAYPAFDFDVVLDSDISD